jgi:fermentation-respiration switch protein FrsA (DUF1100 family)
MGAMTCLLALEKDPRIDCVVADCGGSDFYVGAGEQLKNLYHLPRFPTLPFAELLIRRYGYSFKQVNPAAVVAKTGKPVLFVHGTADLDVPSYMCGELYAQAKNPLSRMELFEGADHGHSYSKDTPRYTKMTQEFVRVVEQSQGIINRV